MINKIIIKERIRKEIAKIPELAEDIRINGLLNPVTVMALDGGDYQLLAGLRRIMAVQSLGMPEIEITVISPADAEAVLRIEISENEQREDFTFSEKMDYARLLEDIEKAKAQIRMLAGKKSSDADPVPKVAQGQTGRTRDIVASKIGMGKTTYDRAKYVAENATPEMIDQLDNGERTIGGTYNELRTQDKSEPLPEDGSADTDEDLTESEAVTGSATQTAAPRKFESASPVFRSGVESDDDQIKYLSEKDMDAFLKLKECGELSPEGRIKELELKLKEARARAAFAVSELSNLKLEYGIKVDHKESIIQSLQRQNAELSVALEAAEARIAELETMGGRQYAECVA